MLNLLPDEVLALTLWGEARGETIEGQVAVANVIMNRWKSNPSKYKSIIDVCLEPKQFSCWNEDDPNKAKMDLIATKVDSGMIPPEIKQQIYIARGVLGFNFHDNTKGSKHYITTSLFDSENRPRWAKHPTNDPVRIGNHIFFNV